MVRFALLLIGLTLVFAPGRPLAASQKNFAVLPFTVNGPEKYAYLSQGLRDMLISRLSQSGKTAPIDKSVVDKEVGQKALTEKDVKDKAKRLGAEYLVTGSVTVMGEEASVDALVYDKAGASKPFSTKGPISKLIPAIDDMAGRMAAQAFDIAPTGGGLKNDLAAPQPRPGEKSVSSAPNAPVREDEPKNVYLNPQFRYAGDAGSEGRIRTQTLPFASVGMTVGDGVGNGKNQVYILRDNIIDVYEMDAENRLVPLGEYKVPASKQNLSINLIDLDRDGVPEIVISAADKTRPIGSTSVEFSPSSYVLSFKGGKFSLVVESVNQYLGMVRRPPDYKPILISQGKGMGKLFAKTVSEASLNGGKIVQNAPIELPSGANVFNFAWLTMSDGKSKVIMTDDREKMKVFSESGELQHTSETQYSGSAIGVEVGGAIPGIVDNHVQKNLYYFPLRLVPIDLTGDRKMSLLAVHPVSVAAQFFERYRFFPQGEVHALNWDGVGMSLLWKTRRIKGTVADFGVADVNNDVSKDLYVCVNTHPGALGVDSRKTIILVYPLDPTRMDKGVTVQDE